MPRVSSYPQTAPARKLAGGRPLLVLAVFIAVLLAGCQRQVAVRMEQRLPRALVEPASSAVELHLEPALGSHVYSGDTPERSHWHIASGAAQAAMFRQIVGDLFTTVREVDAAAAPASLRITPRLRALQFATPEETGLDFFECWVEYEVVLMGEDGQALQPWHFSGYGQAPEQRFGGIAEGVEGALGEALRNAGARLATGFRTHPPVQRYLAGGPDR